MSLINVLTKPQQSDDKMSTAPLIIINEDTVKRLAGWDWIIEAVERAFIAQANNTGEIFPTVLGHGSQQGTILGAKSGVINPSPAKSASGGLLGIKVGTYWPENPFVGIPSHGSTTLLLDNATGFPKALINAHFLNGMRTAAANAVAARYSSNPNATHMAIFGAGSQARFEVDALCQVREIKHVSIVNRGSKKAAIFAEELEAKGLQATICNARQAIENAHLVTTVTASRQPLFEAQWVKPGTHISAMGSDAPGKQEIPPELFSQARLFCDNHDQSTRIGEFQYVTEELKPTITEIGEIISQKANLFSQNQVTLFDSSGIGLQDVAVAGQLLTLAKQSDLIKTIDF
jgi:ornithine cyclodeaminase